MTRFPGPADLRLLLPDVGDGLPSEDEELLSRVRLGDFGAQEFLAMSRGTRRMVVHLSRRGTVDLISAISDNPCLVLPSSGTWQAQYDAEAFTRNHMLVTDCLVSRHGYEIDDLNGPYWVMVVSDSVMGQSTSGEDGADLRAFETRAEVESAASVIAFIFTLSASSEKFIESHLCARSVTLGSGRKVMLRALVDSVVHKFLVENPDEGRSLGEFILERGYSLSDGNVEGLLSVYEDSKASSALRSGFL